MSERMGDDDLKEWHQLAYGPGSDISEADAYTFLDALIAERAEVGRLNDALDAACRAWAYQDDCTLLDAVLKTESGFRVDRPASEFRRFFESGGKAVAE